MSFIENIVEVVNENQHVDARKNLTKLNTEIRSIQSRIRQYLDSKYLNFLPHICNNENFIQCCEKLNEENTQFLGQLSLTKTKIDEANEDASDLQQVIFNF